jgi:CDP-glycerol glycerophosphotransferase (TagB/SpsB family)
LKEIICGVFKKWEQLENCQLVIGDYVDLFIDSDALIHDSGGFMAEYLLLNKPLAYTLNDRDLEVGLNDFGKQLIKFHEIIKNKKELDTFLINVINENDDLKIKKNDFVKNNFIIEGKKASQNIVNEILKRVN